MQAPAGPASAGQSAATALPVPVANATGGTNQTGNPDTPARASVSWLPIHRARHASRQLDADSLHSRCPPDRSLRQRTTARPALGHRRGAVTYRCRGSPFPGRGPSSGQHFRITRCGGDIRSSGRNRTSDPAAQSAAKRITRQRASRPRAAAGTPQLETEQQQAKARNTTAARPRWPITTTRIRVLRNSTKNPGAVACQGTRHELCAL